MWVYLYPSWIETELQNAYIWIPYPESITLNKNSISLTTVWQTEQLTATIEPTVSDKTITWSSDDTAVATVSTSWLVTCVTPWTATITATTVNGLTATCSVAQGLPNAYQEVEWIWSSWTQRIDTWVRPDDYTYWFECKFILTSTSGDWNIMNLWWTSTDNYRYWFGGYYTQNWQIWYPMNIEPVWLNIINPAPSSNTEYVAQYNYNWNMSFILNWNTLTSSLASWSYTYSVNWNIFCQSYWSWNYIRYWRFNLYYMKIWEWTTLLREFVPCYRIADSIIWLYDLVNGVFYTNSWSWTFTKWNDVN